MVDFEGFSASSLSNSTTLPLPRAQPYDWGDRAVEESGKLRVLTLIAQECSRVGEKLVVFSQVPRAVSLALLTWSLGCG